MPAQFFDRHPRLARTLLVLLMPAIPAIALWYGIPEVFADWRADWSYFGESHD